eukprot:Phypoly_transcript_00125.p1 GENE.Phypoly_transcript_00125~~Phypoly_transcript_00125.p1  ORF type:complete len:1089 (+),score=205.59 Phypoly_transcript_00125:3374-6640(+)
MPLVDEVDNGTDNSTRILTRSPKDFLQETIAHTQLLLGGLPRMEGLGNNGVPAGAISYGFFLHELLSITPDSPAFLFNKDIRQMLMDCSHFMQDVSNNLYNPDATNQIFRSGGRYYEQMKGVAIFISEAIGYALFSDSTARELMLGVIELQHTAFLSLILPFCDQPQVYTVLDEIVVGTKTSKLFVIIAKSLMEEFKNHVIYTCMGEHNHAAFERQNELNYVELWCSLLRSLVRNLPLPQDSSPLLAILGKMLQPHFSALLDLATSKDTQIATLVIPLITDIFNAFESSSSLLPQTVFTDFNERVQAFVPFLANVGSRHASVVAQQTIEMFCSATSHPPTHTFVASSRIFPLCLYLCCARQFDTLLGSTIRFCNCIVAQKQNRYCYSVQNDSVAGILISKMKKENETKIKDVEWFILEILRILTEGDLTQIIASRIRDKIKEWSAKIPSGLSSPPEPIEILKLKKELKKLQDANQNRKQNPQPQKQNALKFKGNSPSIPQSQHSDPHPSYSIPHTPHSATRSPHLISLSPHSPHSVSPPLHAIPYSTPSVPRPSPTSSPTPYPPPHSISNPPPQTHIVLPTKKIPSPVPSPSHSTQPSPPTPSQTTLSQPTLSQPIHSVKPFHPPQSSEPTLLAHVAHVPQSTHARQLADLLQTEKVSQPTHPPHPTHSEHPTHSTHFSPTPASQLPESAQSTQNCPTNLPPNPPQPAHFAHSSHFSPAPASLPELTQSTQNCPINLPPYPLLPPTHFSSTHASIPPEPTQSPQSSPTPHLPPTPLPQNCLPKSSNSAPDPKPSNPSPEPKNSNFPQRTNSGGIPNPRSHAKSQPPSGQSHKFLPSAMYVPPHARANPYEQLTNETDMDFALSLESKRNKKVQKETQSEQVDLSEQESEKDPQRANCGGKPKKKNKKVNNGESELVGELSEEGKGEKKKENAKKKNKKVQKLKERSELEVSEIDAELERQEREEKKDTEQRQKEVGSLDPEPKTESEIESDSHSDSEAESDSGSEDDLEPENGAQLEPENDLEPEPELEAEPEHNSSAREGGKAKKNKKKKLKGKKKRTSSSAQSNAGGMLESLYNLGSGLLQIANRG